MDFRSTTVEDLAADVAAREVSARELVQAALDRIDERERHGQRLRGRRRRAGAGRRGLRSTSGSPTGDDVGPLAGIPIGVKDLEDAAGLRHHPRLAALRRRRRRPTADSPSSPGCGPPAAWSSARPTRPRWAGRATRPTRSSAPPRNPWDLEPQRRRLVGRLGRRGRRRHGAAGTGSDGGGSIRIPAALCGLSGFKPSLGRVPIGGPHPPGWADLSTRGPMARTIRDVALALDCVVGPDPTDLRSLPMPDAAGRARSRTWRAPRRVGWSPTLGYAPVDPEVRAICEAAVEQAGRRRHRGRRASTRCSPRTRCAPGSCWR